MTKNKSQTHSNPASMADALSVAIEDLYRKFKRFPRRSPFYRSPPLNPSDLRYPLYMKPLRELSPDELKRYSFSAMTTAGTLEDFKHFLPRICELIAWRQCGQIVVEVALCQLTCGKWTSWPASEREVVRTFLMTWWQHHLSTPVVDEYGGDPTLCAVAHAEDDLAEYLEYWRKEPSLTAALHLADLIDRNYSHLMKKGEMANAFWETLRPQQQQVIAWLCERATGGQLEAAFHLAADDSSRSNLSDAHQKWEGLRLHLSPSDSAIQAP